MRKIESNMLRAINTRTERRLSNTSVEKTERTMVIKLHGNQIAEILWDEGKIRVSNCGWKTNTTKSRLNTLLQRYTNYYLFQKDYEWFVQLAYSELKPTPFTNGMLIPMKGREDKS
jgi:hypothetical protein